MTNSLFEAVVHATRVLTKYGLTVEELAAVVEQNDMSDAEVLAVSKVFDCLLTKQEISTVNFMLRTSRLPMKVPKTFDNFDFSRITGKNVERLRSLPTLSALYARKNLRFLYKGIIIKHNKTEPTYTKTSLFLCEKRRFFMGRTEKGGKVF